MTDTDALIREGQIAACLGAPALALSHYVAAFPNAGPIDRRRLLGAIAQTLGSRSLRLTALARETLASLLQKLEPQISRADAVSLRALIEASPEEPCGVGRVTTLLVAAPLLAGARYGIARILEVDAGTWGGLTQFAHNCESVPWNAFGIGAWAGRRHVLTLAGDDPACAQDLLHRSVVGRFPGIGRNFDVRGGSLALPAAIATVSALLGVSVPADCALTGALEDDGAVLAVGGLEEKLQAAAAYGARRVVLPAGDVSTASDIAARGRLGVELVSVATLAEAVARLFAEADLHTAVAALGKTRRPTIAGESDTVMPRRGLLLSCVGRSDPVGHLLDRHRMPEATEDGPTLQLARRVRPERVALFYTDGPDGSNDFSDKARELRALLKEVDPGCTVEMHPLRGLADPTDFAQLYLVLGREVLASLSGAPASAVTVNVSSGTSQMLVTWLLLFERQVLPPNTALLQARESRHVRRGEAPVRRIRMPGRLSDAGAPVDTAADPAANVGVGSI